MSIKEDVQLLIEDAAEALRTVSAAVARVQLQVAEASELLETLVEATPEIPVPVHPIEASAGTGWELVRDHTFGRDGTVKNIADLEREFQFHDQFGQISCGAGQYGALTAATSESTAINVQAFPVPPTGNFRQPIDSAGKLREFTDESLLIHVRSLVPDGTVGPAWKHTAVTGSLVSRFVLPAGGSDLGRDICWETKFRQVTAPDGYWTAPAWACGSRWGDSRGAKGPEMDVCEAYWGREDSGLRNTNAWHCNSVGGSDKHFKGGDSWWKSLREAGFDVATNEQSLLNVHTFTWVYRRDDTYTVHVDGKLVQEGTLIWRLGGKATGVPVAMWFLHDFSFGHTLDHLWPLNEVTLKPEQLPITGELFSSRIWLR